MTTDGFDVVKVAEMTEVAAAVELVKTLAGRTIVRSEWVDMGYETWDGDRAKALLWLDDGRVIEFGGWGYDDWGGYVEQKEPGEAEAELVEAAKRVGARDATSES